MRHLLIVVALLSSPAIVLCWFGAQAGLRAPRPIPLPSGGSEGYGAQILDTSGGLVFWHDKLWFTSDLGKSWSPVAPPEHKVPQPISRFLSGHFFDRRLGWVQDAGQYFLTSDGGATWRQIVPGPADSLIHSIFFLPGGRIGWAAGGVYRKAEPGDNGPNYVVKRDDPKDPLMILEPAIFLTEDGGRSWSRALVPRSGDWEVRFVTFVTPRAGFAVGDQVLYRSTDGGKTWAPASMPEGCVDWGTSAGPRHVRASAFFPDRWGWISFDDGFVLRTTDGGRTLCQAGPRLDTTLMEMYFTSATEGWANSFPSGICRTRDGGASWQQLNLPFSASLASVSNGHAWIYGPGGLYDLTLGPGRQ